MLRCATTILTLFLFCFSVASGSAASAMEASDLFGIQVSEASVAGCRFSSLLQMMSEETRDAFHQIPKTIRTQDMPQPASQESIGDEGHGAHKVDSATEARGANGTDGEREAQSDSSSRAKYPASGVRPVYFPVFLEDISAIDGETGVWSPCVVVTSRYSVADFPPSQLQPSVRLYSGGVIDIQEARRSEEGGLMRVVERFTATNGLAFDADFRLFPFDRQFLSLPLTLLGMSSDEAQLIQDPNMSSGIRSEVRQANARVYKILEFDVHGWELTVRAREGLDLPYEKPLALLTVHAQRRLPYFVLNCMVIPALMVLFAIGTFYLPLSPIMPRVMVGILSFLSIVVHLTQMMSHVPSGVWSWALSEMIFFGSLLSVAILVNLASAAIANTDRGLAEVHDATSRYMLLNEFVIGMVAMILCKENHKTLCILLISSIGFYHALLTSLSCYNVRYADEPSAVLCWLSFRNKDCLRAMQMRRRSSDKKSGGEDVDAGELDGDAGGGDGDGG